MKAMFLRQHLRSLQLHGWVALLQFIGCIFFVTRIVSVEMPGTPYNKGEARETITGNAARYDFTHEDLLDSCLQEIPVHNLLVESPVPVILLTAGRSGSSSTWQIIGSLTGQDIPSDEYTGSGENQINKFFRKHTTADWLIDVMCKKLSQAIGTTSRERSYPKVPGIVGIKFKPYGNITQAPGAVAAFQYVRDNPHIKIVRSRRNALDRIISRHKHTQSKKDPHQKKLKAHCKSQTCQDQHLLLSSGMILPTDNLLAKLDQMSHEEDALDQFLIRKSIPHVAVSYEKLYNSDTHDMDREAAMVAEWMRIFQFIGRGPATTLTPTMLRQSMQHTSTHHDWHNITLGNYAEVQEILCGTKFEGLLH